MARMKALFQKIGENLKNIAKKTASAIKIAAVKTAAACKKFALGCASRFKELDRKKKIAIALALTVGISAAAGGAAVTLAKYRKEHAGDKALSAMSFYFESNLLNGGTTTYNIYSDTISFDLMNYPDMERVSEVDIKYTVTISSSDGGSLGTGTNTQGTLSCKTNASDTAYKQSKSTVTYSGLTQGKHYTVTAKATAPYTKTISASFYIVPGNYNITSSVEDKGDYVLLTFSTIDYTGNVKITWQNGYVPDNSEPIMTSAIGTSHNTSVTSNTTYTIKFYKTQNATYNASAFSVTKI